MINISEELFISTIDSGFFRHIRKNSVLPQEIDQTREEYLKQLYKKVVTGEYFVAGPRAFKIESKSQKVARIIPMLTVADYCVYYFCVKQVEDELAIDRVANTYGAFSLGGIIRDSEEDQLDAISLELPSTPSRAYNMLGWIESWKDFQKKVWLTASSANTSEFLFSDIANFYDTIDLDKLEAKIRHAVPKDKLPVIHLLFSFLKNWNRKIYGYAHQTKGLPQDEVGDCSRLLANFYLQNYDEKISKYCDDINVTYFRYADDQIFMSNSKKDNLKALYKASVLLHNEGLNFGVSKVKIQDESEFSIYWAFEIFDLLGDSNDKARVTQGTEKYIAWSSEYGKDKFRWWSVLLRIISCDISSLSPELREGIFTDLLKEEFLLDQSSYVFKRIHNALEESKRKDFIEVLYSLSKESRFNAYLYELLDLQRRIEVFTKEQITKIEERIEELSL